MFRKKISLASDNWAPVHPAVLQILMDVNEGCASPYGSDPWTQEAQHLIQRSFNGQARVFFVPTGTGANVLGLKLFCGRHESIICTDIAHIHSQESGAAEAIIGCKLLTVSHREGKMTPDALLTKINNERALGRHATSPRILSITQPTEVGTVYSREEMIALAKLCETENLLLHIDGSRLYQAVAHLGISLQEFVAITHVDILSLGGTKNGLMGAEALLLFHSSLGDGIDYLQKQTLQLPSKMRYVSSQYIPFFKDGLWLTLALQANQKAREIASIIKSIPQFSLSYSVETNQIFFSCPPSWIPSIQDDIFCYLWEEEKNEIRFVTSWNTSEEDVEKVELLLKRISQDV